MGFLLAPNAGFFRTCDIASLFSVMRFQRAGRLSQLFCLAAALFMVFGAFAGQAWSREVPAANNPLEPKAVPPLWSRRFAGEINKIYAFDMEPLGQRVPLILVPGRAEEFQESSWWKKIYRFTHKEHDFQHHFKLYVYLYDSHDMLVDLTASFVREMRRLFGPLPKQHQAILVSYSLGGLISREAMTEPDIFERVHSVFGIAVPYHGTPVFDPDWFLKYLKHPSPIRTRVDRGLYRLYLLDKTNLRAGLKWDNFDHSKPQFGPKLWFGDTLIGEAPLYLEDPPEIRAYKDKLILYACYLENRYTQAAKKAGFNILDVTKPLLLPKQVIGTVLPYYGYNVHGVMRFMNYQLSELATYTPQHPEGLNTRLYRYNDGVVPLSSALFLPPRTEPYQGELREMTHAVDSCFARVFTQVDHVDIGHYYWPLRRVSSRDVLQPELEKRKPYQWLFYDLSRMLVRAPNGEPLRPPRLKPIEDICKTSRPD
jgi:hypothetical protein